jgi:RND family efflux transporter MFP subunit
VETKNADLSSLKIDRTQKESFHPGRKKNIWTAVGIIIVATVAFFSIRAWNSFMNPPLEVKLTTAVLQSPSQTNAILTASGYVVAQREAAVASKGTGRLVQLSVVEGDVVFANQIIARLDDSDIKAQLDEAKANLQLNIADLKDAENTFKRQKELFKTGSSTSAEVDAAEKQYNRVLASIELAKAQVKAAEVSMENMLIRAPFNGTVLTKDADIGEMVTPLAAGANSKAAVVTIADMNSLQVEADVSESNIEKIKLNQDCEIRLDAYPDYAYSGYVAKIVPTADRSKATVMVKIGFKNLDKRVLPEMAAKILFMREALNESELNTVQYLVVPESAIANRNGKQVVYIVREDKTIEIPIQTGKVLGDFVEIKSGLSTGDKVIENVNEEIKDGVKVKIK